MTSSKGKKTPQAGGRQNKDIEKRKINELHLWKDNPRTISKRNFERLKNQIRELGEYKPLIITKDGTALGGNMRLRAYRELGFKECWVSVVGAETEEEKLKYALSDNDQVGEYQNDDLANVVGNLPDINLEDYSVNLGKTTPISDLFPQEIEEDEVPEVGEGEPDSRLGKVYQLGRHRLMCGDATKIKDVGKLMDGKKADMIFTDPPYGMDYSGRGKETSNKMMNDDLDPTDLYNIGSHIKERYIWGRVENYKHLLIEPRDTIIWKKNNFGMGRGYRGQYECCFYYGDFNGSDSDVWEISKDTNYKHPTQKPVALAVRAIKNSNPKIVLDYFGGSGSTLIACEQTNRICYMMELDPKYCDVIRNRYENYKSNHQE